MGHGTEHAANRTDERLEGIQKGVCRMYADYVKEVLRNMEEME